MAPVKIACDCRHAGSCLEDRFEVNELRVVVIGSRGQLGSELTKAFGHDAQVTGLAHSDIEVTDHSAVAEILSRCQPNVVINTSAFHNVDLCETEAASAFDVNALAVLNLARVCGELGAKLVHFSTDYVFGGARSEPYGEDIPVEPLSVYGNSKVAGEQLVRISLEDHLLIRTAALYGPSSFGNPNGNFVEKMISLAESGRALKVVSDQRTGPTYTPDLAKTVVKLVERKATGTFHVSNTGSVTWHEFASAIFRHQGLTCDLSETDSASFGAPAPRPAYSVLSNEKQIQTTGDQMRSWKTALVEYLDMRNEALRAA